MPGGLTFGLPMLAIENTLIDEALLEEAFVCDLSRCRGACCVEGDAGAPLEGDEVGYLKQAYPAIAPFLRPEGRAAITEQGTALRDPNDGEWVTPLVQGRECAYALFDAEGTAQCGIEKAWQAGAVALRKPISCHLYPVRIARYPAFLALHYHRWTICSPACTLGEALKVPVFRFVAEALRRKFGSEWFEQLEAAAALKRGQDDIQKPDNKEDR